MKPIYVSIIFHDLVIEPVVDYLGKNNKKVNELHIMKPLKISPLQAFLISVNL